MGNREHVKRLLLGVEYWNASRRSEQFRPDFEAENIYAEFHQAGKLDAEGQVPLQGVDLDDANLHRSNFSRCNLAGAKLRNSDLRYADFNRADLSRARIMDSRLDGMLLNRGCLNGSLMSNVTAEKAHFEGADFTSAFLVEVTLEGADLSGANLTRCKLVQCKLDNANLSDAKLTDAAIGARTTMYNTVLARSRPSEARLFESPDIVEQFEDVEPTVDSVAQTIAAVRDLQGRYNGSSRVVSLYFRGEPRTVWTLTPAMMRKFPMPNVDEFSGVVDRLDTLDPETLHDYAHYLMTFQRRFDLSDIDDAPSACEGEMLLDLMSRRPHDFASAPTALAQWSLAQHHGLNTRLLDVTRNLLVALYFACENHLSDDGRIHLFVVPTVLIKPYNSDTVSILANFAKLDAYSQLVLLGNGESSFDTIVSTAHDHNIAMRKLYHLIREEKPQFSERIDPRDLFRILVVEPQKTSERIQAQSGAFMVSAFHDRFERSEIQRVSPHTPVYAHYELTVPAGDPKSRIREELQVMGITRETLFPGLESSAGAVNELYRQRSQ